MDEVLTVAFAGDELAGGLIDLPAGDLAPGLGRFLHGAHANVARIAHDLEDLAMAIAGGLADEAAPGDVVEDGAGLDELGPDVEQNEVAFLDGLRGGGTRLVVRVAAVRVHAHDGRVFGHQALAPEGLQDPLLHQVLIGAAVAHATADLLEALGHDAVDLLARGVVRGDLLVGPGSLEARDQVAGADDLLPEAANEFNGAGVHQSDVGDKVVGRS